LSITSWFTGLILLTLTMLPMATAKAEVFNSADFRITTTEKSNIVIFSAQLPTTVISSTDIQWPTSCKQISFEQQPFGSKSQLLYKALCPTPFTNDSVINTPWLLDGARLYLSLGQSDPMQITLNKSYSSMQVPLYIDNLAAQSTFEVLQKFLWQGMIHIWMGWDHIAFVFCLCLLASGYRLFALVSAFTIGHSITLGLAYFQLINIPIQPIEVLIALSIVLMAREIILTKEQQSPRGIYSALTVVILFGLVHGLGFASALKELGVQADDIWLSLLMFNLGVEAGQLIFVLTLLIIFAGLGKIKWQPAAKNIGVYSVGGLGVFWTLERIAVMILV